jgi:hypothetical protein
MHGKFTETATKFVDLVLSRTSNEWAESKVSPPEELQTLFEVVTAAGFEARSIELGKLAGFDYDEYGNGLGESYPINQLCPYKVMGEDGNDYYFATGWLDCALRRVFGSERQKEEVETLVKIVAREINRSNPLDPIQLTPDGDMLVENAPHELSRAIFGYFVDHYRDEHQLRNYPVNRWSSGIGIHGLCGGQLIRVSLRNTETQDEIVCSKCRLRVSFPRGVSSYGELRQSLASVHTQPVA